MYFKEIIDEFNCGKKLEEVAKKAIETIGEERIKKYYFGVEDE